MKGSTHRGSSPCLCALRIACEAASEAQLAFPKVPVAIWCKLTGFPLERTGERSLKCLLV
jgi:hypothetical protein